MGRLLCVLMGTPVFAVFIKGNPYFCLVLKGKVHFRAFLAAGAWLRRVVRKICRPEGTCKLGRWVAAVAVLKSPSSKNSGSVSRFEQFNRQHEPRETANFGPSGYTYEK